jgi:hypothetical protein
MLSQNYLSLHEFELSPSHVAGERDRLEWAVVSTLWPNLKFAVANDSTTRDNYSTSGNVNPYTALLERGTPASKPGRRIGWAA